MAKKPKVTTSVEVETETEEELELEDGLDSAPELDQLDPEPEKEPVLDDPELEPITPPLDFDEDLPNPTTEELYAANKLGKDVLVKYVGPGERAKIAGLVVDRVARVHGLYRIFDMGPDYVRALATNSTVRVRIL